MPVPLCPIRFTSAASALVGLRTADRPSGTAPALGPTAYEFVQHVGYWSHYDEHSQTSAWPLPTLINLDALARFARDRCVLRQSPMVGDIALIWSHARQSFVRAAVVVVVGQWIPSDKYGLPAWECTTIEGDSDENLRLGGGAVMRHSRRLALSRGDRFVHWPALDERFGVDELRAGEGRAVMEVFA